MRKDSTVDVLYTVGNNGKPLVIVRDSPLGGLDAEARPEELRLIAAILVQVAEKSEALGVKAKEQQERIPLWPEGEPKK